MVWEWDENSLPCHPATDFISERIFKTDQCFVT